VPKHSNAQLPSKAAKAASAQPKKPRTKTWQEVSMARQAERELIEAIELDGQLRLASGAECLECL
jgi:hypothetical protein